MLLSTSGLAQFLNPVVTAPITHAFGLKGVFLAIGSTMLLTAVLLFVGSFGKATARLESTEPIIHPRALEERSMDFEGTIVLVTGASTGFGRAIAVGAAHYGAKIVGIIYARSETEARQTADLVRDKGAEPVLLQGDVGEDADCRRIAALHTRFGHIDALFNNAGNPASDAADEIPEPESKHAPVSRLGDLWQIGGHGADRRRIPDRGFLQIALS